MYGVHLFLAAASAKHWAKALAAEAVQTMVPKICCWAVLGKER
jgi:hypothetical protein